MTKLSLLTLTVALLLPSAASAATVTADVERRQGAPFGPVTFKAARGEVNDVTVTQVNGRLRFRDPASFLAARGDCEQVSAHTATCPFTEDIAKVKLGNRDDEARVEGLVEVLGGSGSDVLRGSGGNDILNGQRGADTLRGGGDADELTGGRGRDRVFGGGGDDDLIDGESDRAAARDLFVGGRSRDTSGADRGDLVDYSKRDRALDIDLARKRVTAGRENDVLRGLESVEGGSGNDRLSGDLDDNWLDGNGGNDRLAGRGGDDIPSGGNGDDTVLGGGGNDALWGQRGSDALSGGGGDDLLIANDSSAETLDCGTGDDDARTTRLDTLENCEVATAGSLYVRAQPEIEGDTATFQVACQRLGGCSGTLAMRGPSGEDYGSTPFAGLPDDPETFSPVAIRLTPAGQEALAEGVVVQVTHGEAGGYQAFMQS